MRFWLCVSLCFAIVSAYAGGSGSAQVQVSESAKHARRRNELRLAGIRPGLDSLSRVTHLYQGWEPSSSEDLTKIWIQPCSARKLIVEGNSHGVVEAVRLVHAGDVSIPQCELAPGKDRLQTGSGLSVGSFAAQVPTIYGEPTSRSPSTKNGQPLELLYYAFDWAGPDVPQVMEVVCTAPKDGSPGRVVEITLAASSL